MLIVILYSIISDKPIIDNTEKTTTTTNSPININTNVKTTKKIKKQKKLLKKDLSIDNENKENKTETSNKIIPIKSENKTEPIKPKNFNIKHEISKPERINDDLIKNNYSKDEINLLKNFNHRNRGYFIQTLNNKIVLNRWIKAKNTYNDILSKVKDDYDTNGKYITYIIWDGDVIKTKMKNKIKLN